MDPNLNIDVKKKKVVVRVTERWRELARNKQENLTRTREKLGKSPIFTVSNSDYVGALCELAFAYAFRLPLPKDWLKGFLGSDKGDFKFSDGKSVDVKGRSWRGDNILLMIPAIQFFRKPKNFYVLARLQETHVEFLGFISYSDLKELQVKGQVKIFRDDAGPTVYVRLHQLRNILILYRRYCDRV